MSEDFDSNKAVERVEALWLALAEQIAAAVPDRVDRFGPVEAIRWATCAEACFWQATGEADSHDIKDVLAPPSHKGGVE